MFDSTPLQARDLHRLQPRRPFGTSPARSSPRWSSAFVALLIALPSLAVLVPTSSADEVTPIASLPSERRLTAAVWDGASAYIFGGVSGTVSEATTMDKIVRFDPATNTVTNMTATLPSRRYGASAVFANGNAYIFGGDHGTGQYLNQIVRYNITTDTVTSLAATLLAGRYATSAVWDGTNAYIFGGHESSTNSAPSNGIVRFNPATETATLMTGTLPSPRVHTSAVWDGTYAYVFGGWTTVDALDQIVRYDPATDTATLLNTTLPAVYLAGSALWDGSNAYIFGGQSGTGLVDSSAIVHFNPSSGIAANSSATLPTARYGTSAVWAGSSGFVFGGYDDADLNEILRFDPSRPPSAPQNAAASSGPGAGQISLSWQAPADDGGAAVANYKVYRATAATGPFSVVATLGGDALAFQDTGLGNGATRYYKVAAVNGAGEGAASDVVSATTFNLPGAPTGLTATASMTFETITLSWSAPTDDGGDPVDTYHIWRSSNRNGAYTNFANVAAPTTTYDDHPADFDGWWYYVTAENLAGQGPQSNTVCAVGGDATGMTQTEMAMVIEVGCTEV